MITIYRNVRGNIYRLVATYEANSINELVKILNKNDCMSNPMKIIRVDGAWSAEVLERDL